MEEIQTVTEQVAQDLVQFEINNIASHGAESVITGQLSIQSSSVQTIEKFAFAEVLGKILSSLFPIHYIPGLITSFLTRFVFNKNQSTTRMLEETTVNGGISMLLHLLLGPLITPLGVAAVSSATTTVVDHYLFDEGDATPEEILKKINEDKLLIHEAVVDEQPTLLWLAPQLETVVLSESLSKVENNNQYPLATQRL